MAMTPTDIANENHAGLTFVLGMLCICIGFPAAVFVWTERDLALWKKVAAWSWVVAWRLPPLGRLWIAAVFG